MVRHFIKYQNIFSMRCLLLLFVVVVVHNVYAFGLNQKGTTKRPSSVPTSPTARLLWRKCADEGGICKCPRGSLVRYGKKDKWIIHFFPARGGRTACTKDNFGSDPYPFVLKECQCSPPPTR